MHEYVIEDRKHAAVRWERVKRRQDNVARKMTEEDRVQIAESKIQMQKIRKRKYGKSDHFKYGTADPQAKYLYDKKKV